MTAALAGLRVVDLGMITAGAAASQVLADFGADVIKVESPSRPDPFRNWNQIARDTDVVDLNESPPFHVVNRNKRSIGIDLKNPEGRAVFLDLVACADVVVENFRRGVMAGLGLSFADLTAVNPRIVLLSLGSQGEDGPEARYVSFGSTLEAIGGSMAITGYDAGHPVWTGNNVNYPDQLVSIAAPGVVLAALIARDRTGLGVHVDLAQRESVTSLLGETIVEHQLTGDVPHPLGNDDPATALQGVFACRGDEEWIAVTAAGSPEASALARVLGIPEPDADRAAFSQTVAAAVADRDAAALAEELQAAGVAASRVQRAADLADDPQLAALGFFVEAPGRPERQRGFVARLSATPGAVERRAPDLGQHSREILAQTLGYDRATISRLTESGAVYSPAGAVGATAADTAAAAAEESEEEEVAVAR